MQDLTMVVDEIDWENKTALVSLANRAVKYQVYKPNDGTILYRIKTTGKSSIPSELSGQYSSIPKALEALEYFAKNTKESFAVKSERLDKERKERHAAAAKSTDSK